MISRVPHESFYVRAADTFVNAFQDVFRRYSLPGEKLVFIKWLQHVPRHVTCLRLLPCIDLRMRRLHIIVCAVSLFYGHHPVPGIVIEKHLYTYYTEYLYFNAKKAIRVNLRAKTNDLLIVSDLLFSQLAKGFGSSKAIRGIIQNKTCN